MRYDLKTPCKNCPFRTDATAIRFAARERAEEIEESAYRHGFPCHLSAEIVEDEDGGSSGYVAGRDTQHCVGYAIMRLNEDEWAEEGWPGIGNDDRIAARIASRVDRDAPVFKNTDEFFAANEAKR